MKTLGIYVSVPFCQTRCTYCNFHTGVVATEKFAPYVDAVRAEIRGREAFYRTAGVEWDEAKEPIVVDTVYVGGGTPSLLAPVLLRGVLEEIQASFRCELQEVTLEADPETVEEQKAAAWVAAGINRVSFGVQSFVDKELAAAGRMHRRADIYRAEKILREAGIRNISFDLIAGLPHQTRTSWQGSLGELIELSPEHVSVYLLEVDEGSRLGKEILSGGGKYSAGAVPAEDEMAEFYEEAQQVLEAAGYHHYEISNWGKPGFESKHNLKYWRREAYLGFGAGAHSFSGKQRWANMHDAAEYVAAMERRFGAKTGLEIVGRVGTIEQLETVTKEQELDENLFLGLRQLDGIDWGRIEKAYGEDVQEKIRKLQTAELVERDGEILRLSKRRLSISNEVFVELMRGNEVAK
jgi:oxygen-independent coproporphyrinogen-3 oxidase